MPKPSRFCFWTRQRSQVPVERKRNYLLSFVFFRKVNKLSQISNHLKAIRNTWVFGGLLLDSLMLPDPAISHASTPPTSAIQERQNRWLTLLILWSSVKEKRKMPGVPNGNICHIEPEPHGGHSGQSFQRVQAVSSGIFPQLILLAGQTLYKEMSHLCFQPSSL